MRLSNQEKLERLNAILGELSADTRPPEYLEGEFFSDRWNRVLELAGNLLLIADQADVWGAKNEMEDIDISADLAELDELK